MGGILLWIMLISVAVAAGVTAFASSRAGRLWPVDTRELRRQQRFEHVLTLHVHAAPLSRPAVVAPGRPPEEPVGGTPRLSEEWLRLVHETWRSLRTDRHDWAPRRQSTSLGEQPRP